MPVLPVVLLHNEIPESSVELLYAQFHFVPVRIHEHIHFKCPPHRFPAHLYLSGVLRGVRLMTFDLHIYPFKKFLGRRRPCKRSIVHINLFRQPMKRNPRIVFWTCAPFEKRQIVCAAFARSHICLCKPISGMVVHCAVIPDPIPGLRFVFIVCFGSPELQHRQAVFYPGYIEMFASRRVHLPHLHRPGRLKPHYPFLPFQKPLFPDDAAICSERHFACLFRQQSVFHGLAECQIYGRLARSFGNQGEHIHDYPRPVF